MGVPGAEADLTPPVACSMPLLAVLRTDHRKNNGEAGICQEIMAATQAGDDSSLDHSGRDAGKEK